MLTLYIYSDVTGLFKRLVQSTDQDVLNLQVQQGEVAFENVDDAENKYLNPQGQLRPLPERPPYAYDFRRDLGQWQDSRGLEELRALKRVAIERARDAKLAMPTIVYDGKNLDADAGAKANLQDKITAVASRISTNRATPVQMLVWRDRDNKVWTFNTLQEYRNWLDGYVIALEERGMQAWAWSWQMKDALNAFTTIEQVDAFVVPDVAP